MVAAVFANEQGAHGVGVLEVVRVGHFVGIAFVIAAVSSLRGWFPGTHEQSLQAGSHPLAADQIAGRIHLTALQVGLVDDTAFQVLGLAFKADVILRTFTILTGQHALLHIGHGEVQFLVSLVGGYAFHLGELGGCAQESGETAGFQESGGFFHAVFELQVFQGGAAAAAGVGVNRFEAGMGSRISPVFGVAGNFKDVGELDAARHQRIDFAVGRVTELEPLDAELAAVGGIILLQFGGIQAAAGQIPGSVGDEHGQHHIIAVIALVGSSAIWHDMGQFIGQTSHGVVLGNFGLAACVHAHFGDHAVSVWIGAAGRKLSGSIPVQVHGS